MDKLWTDDGWADYIYWQSQDKKTLKKINELIKDIDRNGLMQGIGKPEELRHRLGVMSRRIDNKNRLLYTTNEQGQVVILSCRGHYED